MESFPQRIRREEGKLEQAKMEVARQKAEKLLASDRFRRINEDNFPNYDPVQLTQDKLLVDSLKKKWHVDKIDPRETQEGTISEGFVFDMIGNAQWFGNASIKRTSEYDDFINHVDAILGLHVSEPHGNSSSYLGLGLDSTTSKYGVDKKLQGIIQRIRQGDLGTIKYAEIDHFKGEMRLIPEVVLYMDRKNFFDVTDRWIVPNMQKKLGVSELPEELSRKFNTLAIHPLQLEFLAQMYIQLDAFANTVDGSKKERLNEIKSIILKKLKERMDILKIGKNSANTIWQSESVSHIRDSMKKLA